MPLSCCSEARFIASLTSSLLVAFFATILRSITETFGVGTRMATPSSLPLSSGSTRPIALAAPVEVVVHRVERRLVAGVGVDRRHESGFDADRVVEHLCDGCKAIGGARAVGNDLMILGQLVVIDAEDHGEVGAVGGSRNQHALG